MDESEVTTVKIDVSRIPASVQRQLAEATLSAMRRTQRENPELWAKIEARAAEINEGRDEKYGGI